MKITRAWAVLEDGKLSETTYSHQGHRHYDLFPTKREAREYVGLNEAVIIEPVIISVRKRKARK